MTMRLVVTGGGTGGHIYPAIAEAEYILQQDPGSRITFIGSESGPEREAAAAAGLPFEGLDVSGVAGKGILAAAAAAVKFLKASLRCLALLRREDPEVVFGTGGFAAAPACFAALIKRVPLVLLEMNYEPGIVTRLFSRSAKYVAVAYQETAALLPERARARVTGIPVRRAIAALSRPEARQRARRTALEEMHLSGAERTMLVFGGSQGAEALNDATWGAMARLEGVEGLVVVHLTGTRSIDRPEVAETCDLLEGTGVAYRAIGYCEKMELLFALADIAVTRAGAGTLAELVAAGLPAVLVPYPYAGAHQEKNARALERAGSAVVVPQDAQSADAALARGLDILSDETALAAMREAAAAASRQDGAEGIELLLEELR